MYTEPLFFKYFPKPLEFIIQNLQINSMSKFLLGYCFQIHLGSQKTLIFNICLNAGIFKNLPNEFSELTFSGYCFQTHLGTQLRYTKLLIFKYVPNPLEFIIPNLQINSTSKFFWAIVSKYI